ncbi:uncharacterized protein LOC132729840 [Ruditapes philippinarum]|uniref:uncharacterized protein LOC132729840 n=1 Tax=Ruditapes philippinarum TaxID=129788 RepID=UPI00295B1101|nr:uncharacterized protein LOC132729840 [Ruditapes philippinarum]
MMLFVFIGWTITSFACHFCAKLFIKESTSFTPGNGNNIIVLTVLQVFFYMQVASFTDDNDKGVMVNKLVIFIAHACATLATNWSMAVTYVASTFAVKLMEPVTSALLQKLILKIELSYLQYISIPAVVCGSILFAQENNTWKLNVSKGTVLAFISNICLSLRNVYMKKNHISHSKFIVNKTHIGLGLFVVFAVGALVLFDIGIAPTGTAKLYFLLIGSSLFHAIYSYISTVVVLHHFSVIGHAFGNILKRLAVLGLLYVTGSKTSSIVNFIGLFTCATGLTIYAFSKVHELNQHQINKEFQTVMSYKRHLFFTLVTIIVFFLALNQFFRGHTMMLELLKCRTKYVDGNNDSYKLLWNNLSLSKQATFNIKDFLTLDLAHNPEESNKLSILLTKRSDVIDEAQRIHMNIFKSLLGGYKYAMLFDYSHSENKGDSAITVGETLLLRKLKIEIVFVCKIHCIDYQLDRAHNISKKYTSKDLVILFHGGGNVIGWPLSDVSRGKQIKRFMQFNIVMFPQSILIMGPDSHIKFCQKIYASHQRLTFLWRDKVSFDLGKKLFPKVRSLLSPDIAYQIGFVSRFMYPTFDILWIRRTDKESPHYNTPLAPEGYRMHVSDWLMWKNPRGDSPMEDSFLMTTNGMMFLQRGRVVITDRLHGHILSTLLNIPHVYIDNKQRKISNYHTTWTAGLDNVVLANSSIDAVEKAKELLLKLDKELPSVKGYFI